MCSTSLQLVCIERLRDEAGNETKMKTTRKNRKRRRGFPFDLREMKLSREIVFEVTPLILSTHLSVCGERVEDSEPD